MQRETRRTTSKNRGQIQSSPVHKLIGTHDVQVEQQELGHRSHRTRRQSPRWSRRPWPCENPPPSPWSPPLDTIRLSNCRAQTCGTHMLVLRHEAHLLPDVIRTSRTPRPTIRCRQPTPRNAAAKTPPCNFARLAADLDIPKTIRQQRVEWDVRLQVTDLPDSLRRSSCTAEDVQLFNMFQYMLKMMVS